MSTRRPILIALIALAVALLPMAGGMAVATPHAAFTAPQADCCPNGKPCEKKTNGCGSVAGCVLKCFNLTGAVAAPFAACSDAIDLGETRARHAGLPLSNAEPASTASSRLTPH